MENEYIRISELNPIPEDWSEERVAQFMSDGLLPVSDTTSGITYKVLVGFMLSYALGNSVTKESISYEFDNSIAYTKDSLCIYERDLYIAKEDMQAGDWDSTKWTKIPVTVLINKLTLMNAVQYDSSNSYGINDFCTYDFELYKCKAANVTGAWDSTKWNKVDVGTELKSLLNWIDSHSNLSQFTDDITQSSFLYTGTAPVSGSAVYDFGKSVISAQYNPSSTYNKNYVCFNNGTLYKCLEDNVTGAWNATKWQQTTIASVLSSVSDIETATDADIDGLFVEGTSVIGGRTYRTVTIGNQEWLAENLDFKFCNIGGSGTPTTANAWYYENDESTYGVDGYNCGLLYNWFAVKLLEDSKDILCPGWHVPTVDDWNTLANEIGSNPGTKLKALDNSVTDNWPSDWNGYDDYEFNALPAGQYNNGNFAYIGTYSAFWTTKINNYGGVTARSLSNNSSILNISSFDSRYAAISLRLVRNLT